MTTSFYSHGKLLLTSEYLVLDGAEALALPTKRGQQLEVTINDNKKGIFWESILEDGSQWFNLSFNLPLDSKTVIRDEIAERLHDILIAAQTLNPDFLKTTSGYSVQSTLEFPRDWGLGSSSTLIANIAAWAQVDPYKLLEATFGGSGYDIACAVSQTPIIYKRTATAPIITKVDFNPSFKDQLFFVHLNRKQNSRESIKHYRSLQSTVLAQEVIYFSKLTHDVLNCSNLTDFESTLLHHEERLSSILKTPTIKSQLFRDYPHLIKSLGGWGGDFIMVIGNNGDMDYFKKKGFKTIVPYSEMILGQ